MNETIFIDIETIPCQRDDVRAYIAASVKPPATIKLDASLKKWDEESRPGAVDEAVHKTSLDGAFGRICCIGAALDNDGDPVVFWGLNESAVMMDFSKWLDESFSRADFLQTAFVGHNVAAFDLRFLMQRHIVNGIRPHPMVARAAHAKPWESEKVFDTMVQFSGIGNRISLDKLCMALSIESPKGDLDGSKVWEYVQAGRLDEVAEYCARDVLATRQVFRRMTFA